MKEAVVAYKGILYREAERKSTLKINGSFWLEWVKNRVLFLTTCVLLHTILCAQIYGSRPFSFHAITVKVKLSELKL